MNQLIFWVRGIRTWLGRIKDQAMPRIRDQFIPRIMSQSKPKTRGKYTPRSTESVYIQE